MTPPAANAQQWDRLLHEVAGLDADRFDAEERLPPEVVQALARAGLLGAAVSSQHGGGGVSPLDFGELCASFGGASASLLSLLTVHTMVALTLQRWGSPMLRERWLPGLASGARTAAFALTESEAGSDASAISTEIRRDGDRLVLTGRKRWISFGQSADMFLVAGRCDGRVVAAMVPRDTPGLVATPISGMLGFRAAMLADLEFDACVVPADQMVCSTDFGVSQIVGSALDHGRYCIAWGAAGLAAACLRETLRYTNGRQQFGSLLRDQPLVQALVGDMATQVRTARLLCEDAARLRAERSVEAIGATMMAKLHAADVVNRVAATAVQLHGAHGCSAHSPVQRMFRDAKILELIEGGAQLLRMQVAEHAYLSMA